MSSLPILGSCYVCSGSVDARVLRSFAVRGTTNLGHIRFLTGSAGCRSAVEQTDYGAIARAAGLERVGARPNLLFYIKDAWSRRAFAITLARYRVEADNNENRLGLAWVVLKPLINAVVYGLVFGVVLDSSARPVASFIPFLVVGIFIFEFFSQSFGGGAKSITSNQQLVKSLSFPRVLLPIAAVLQELFELIPILVVMGAIVAIFGEPITLRWLLVFPAIALMAIFNMGIAFIAARLTVLLPDIGQIIPFVTRIFFYSTGIFYSTDLVLANKPELLFITRLNPIHDYIGIIRYAMIPDMPYDPIYWTIGISGAVIFLLFGFVFFWLAEEEYGRD
jgi:teichoic acid transport system permease protein